MSEKSQILLIQIHLARSSTLRYLYGENISTIAPYFLEQYILKTFLGEKGFLRAILALSATILSTYHTVVSEGHTRVSYEPDGPEDV